MLKKYLHALFPEPLQRLGNPGSRRQYRYRKHSRLPEFRKIAHKELEEFGWRTTRRYTRNSPLSKLRLNIDGFPEIATDDKNNVGNEEAGADFAPLELNNNEPSISLIKKVP